ncbi:hypothetical protein Sjap_009352 [Stephania japonica]|uniref:Uncharacterized protein n=1 Tax=Stephania japonica TaxID=461633 RepID=A0AAP0PBN3_9MAGN
MMDSLDCDHDHEDPQNRIKFKMVCVFCGSSSGNRKVFSDATIDFGNKLGR